MVQFPVLDVCRTTTAIFFMSDGCGHTDPASTRNGVSLFATCQRNASSTLRDALHPYLLVNNHLCLLCLWYVGLYPCIGGSAYVPGDHYGPTRIHNWPLQHICNCPCNTRNCPHIYWHLDIYSYTYKLFFFSLSSSSSTSNSFQANTNFEFICITYSE